MRQECADIVYIGIDPSIDSTGICIHYKNKYSFFIVTSHLTNKEKTNYSSITGRGYKFEYVTYEKVHVDGEYWEKEEKKIHNFKSIISSIKDILKKYRKHPIIVGIEGISYGSSIRTQAVFDLAGLNYLIRNLLQDLNSQMFVISPGTNKKFATGKGNATKDAMNVGLISLFPKLADLKKYDDIADAFWLCECAKSIFYEKHFN